jgi:hypothetical protein
MGFPMEIPSLIEFSASTLDVVEEILVIRPIKDANDVLGSKAEIIR